MCKVATIQSIRCNWFYTTSGGVQYEEYVIGEDGVIGITEMKNGDYMVVFEDKIITASNINRVDEVMA